MLTEEEMQEYIDMAERDEWDPARWKDVTPEPVVIEVRMQPNQVTRIDRRAIHAGMTRSEYIRDLIARDLATA